MRITAAAAVFCEYPIASSLNSHEMKKIILLSISFFTFAGLFAQSSFPTHSESPEWFVKIYGEAAHVDKTVYTESPIIICGEIWTPAYTQSDFGDPAPKFLGFYRTEGQRVYFRATEQCSDPDHLLYDYSLEVGQSVEVSLYVSPFDPVGIPVTMQVYEVSSNTYLGVERKILGLVYLAPSPLGGYYTGWTAWIEGVGSSDHPFYPRYCMVDCQYGGFSRLRCFRNGQGLQFGWTNSGTGCGARRFYVDHAATGLPADGSSWAQAFRTLQDALSVAVSGDTVWVAQGVYFPTDDGDRSKSFTPRSGVAVYGGFNGTESELSQRDIVANETILSGDIGQAGLAEDNSYHVVYILGGSSATVIDGFTIAHGYAKSPVFGNAWRGGGMLVDTDAAHPVSAPVVRNCLFRDNFAEWGGALFCNGDDDRYADPGLESCVFINNRSNLNGGAVYKRGAARPNRPHVIKDCLFEDNDATLGTGGGINYHLPVGDHVLENCAFIRDSSISDGGGIYALGYHTGGASFTFLDCRFEENHGNSGGGFTFLYFDAPNNELVFNLDFRNTVFVSNTTRSAGGGAILSATDWVISHLNVAGCTFQDNYSLGDGSAILFQNYSNSDATLTVDRSRFIGNRGGTAAIYCTGDPIPWEFHRNTNIITNSLFAGNQRGSVVVIGSQTAAASTVIKNCSFYRNGTRGIGKGWSQALDNVTYYNVMEISNSVVWEPQLSPTAVFARYYFLGEPDTSPHLYDYTLRNNLVHTSAPCLLPGGDEACMDNLFGILPGFLDTLQGDFRLRACSPLINAGDSTGLDTLGLLLDLSGNPRILEGQVDIGAFERLAFQSVIEETISATCADAVDGMVIVTTTGDDPIQYDWSNSTASGQGSGDLAAGAYQFTVTDAYGCRDTLTVEITSPPPLSAEYAATQASNAEAADGSLVQESISGGSPPYQYQWSTGDTTASLFNLPPGEYLLTVLDSVGCSAEFGFEITFPNSAVGAKTPALAMQVFPNPGPGRFAVWFSRPVSGSIAWSVRDMAGRLLAQGRHTGGEQMAIALPPSVADGVYVLTVQTEEGVFVERVGVR
jgi:hypothetical protein